MTALKKTEAQIRFGVSPLGWTNDVLADLGGDIPLEVCLREASEIGYEGVELGRKFPRNAKELLPKLEEFGLQLVGGWYSGFLAERSLEEEWLAASDHVRLLEECGSQVLVYGECARMPGDSPFDRPLSESPALGAIELSGYVEKVNGFAARLKHRGIQLAYHYHLMMLVETAEEIAAFFGATSDDVGLLLDTGHAYAAGADYGEILRRFGNRVVHIHLKDVRRQVLDKVRKDDASFNAAVRAGMFTIPGDGDVDFSQIRSFVRASGYSGWVVIEAEQDPAKANPRLYAQSAYRYVKKLIL
jgi:inosose dehydratase